MAEKTFDEIKRMLARNKEEHRRLSDGIMQRLRMSRDKMSERYAQMADNEKQFNAYVPARDVDIARKRQKDTSGEHDYVTIEVPYSYAVTMTIHTYLTSVFMARNPVYQIQARHGEPEMSVQALEALLDYQRLVGRHTVPLYAWLFDPMRYGFGVIGQYWDEQTIRTRRFVPEQAEFLGEPNPYTRPKMVAQVERIQSYSGTKLFNVRPQDFFPDVRLPLARFQEGEFCGRYVEIPWHEIEQGEAEGRYFNVKEAKRALRSEGILHRDTGADQVSSLPGEEIDDYTEVYPYTQSDRPDSLFKGYEFQWKLSPKRWKLGEENAYEVWVFTINKVGTIIEARPMGMFYDGFNYDVVLFEPDGYNLFPFSGLERIKPLNDVLSWLVNSHFYNIRSALNNQFIVDPSMVVMKDVTSRRPGQIIRLKPEAFGRDVRMAIQQLPTVDVTRTHLQDIQIVEQMIQRVLGATDQVMGMQNQSGRRTATEVRTATGFGANRLKTMCELASAYGMEPMLQRMIQATQQMYNGTELEYRLVGDLAAFTPQHRQITPDEIAGFYDYLPVDGTLPIDRYAQAQLWQTLMGQIVNFPQIMQQYDIGKIFAWVASLAGLKNIQQFKIDANSPQALMGQVQAGNMVPVEQAMQELGTVPDNGRPQGMGTTG